MSQGRPVVVVSGCLEFEPCRYNGRRISFGFIHTLEAHVDLVPVCPEVAIGLGTPRDPIRLVDVDGKTRLVQPSTDRDLTRAMERFADRFLTARRADGYILKSRSPSCGTRRVKVYDGPEARSARRREPGLFAAAVRERAPEAAIEEEVRLQDSGIREHFLTKLFTIARLRHVELSGRIGRLVSFHARHELLFMAYNQTATRQMGRIVANPDRQPFRELIAAYRPQLARALKTAPRVGSALNVLEGAFGFVSDRLKGSEKRFYRRQLERYRQRRIPLGAVASVIRGWAQESEAEYLLNQHLFQPFPEDLMSGLAPAKGRLARS